MNIYDFTIKGQNEEIISMEEYKDKVLLIVNSATKCGFTPQYDWLQDMYELYADEGFVILDFPCNQFANQAPESDSEIVEFCSVKFGISFPIFSKINVNGEDAEPLFKYLKQQQGFKGFDEENPATPMMNSMLERIDPDYKNKSDIKWNFTKFLVDRDGNVVERFEPTADSHLIEEKIKSLI